MLEFDQMYTADTVKHGASECAIYFELKPNYLCIEGFQISINFIEK